eukprot:CAMPEP_0197847518 /NCGR_PEP_ID=MMETSP1438-20131217/6359_1 /TAXON_ID=1461541 /ORGANISM="Pterosperma sp., Strain CCMP1384" /LENGTH=49 /DNA_ID=CAMNT_0043459463 /DNA_START=884 /DNA_END=1033 /DNA_ORIENTATION=+
MPLVGVLLWGLGCLRPESRRVCEQVEGTALDHVTVARPEILAMPIADGM